MKATITFDNDEELWGYLEYLAKEKVQKVQTEDINPKQPEISEEQKQQLKRLEDMQEKIEIEKKKIFSVPEPPQIDNSKAKGFFSFRKNG